MIATRVEHASAQACRDTADPEAVGCRADVRTDPPQFLDHALAAVGLLEPQLCRARDDGLAARMAGSEGEQGKLVHEARNFRRDNGCPDQL